MRMLITTAAAVVLAGSAVMAAEKVERPAYEVIATGERAELRRYAPMIVAEVTVNTGNRRTASSAGFTPLANYIFGKNRPGEKIDMTAPVTTTPASGGGALTGGSGEKIAMTAPVTTTPSEGDGSYVVRFTMPSKWTMETLPKPENDAVRLRDLPAHLAVAVGFTGRRDDAAIARAEEIVNAFIDAQGLTPVGPMTIAGYSSPRVPEARREWEVMRNVAEPEG